MPASAEAMKTARRCKMALRSLVSGELSSSGSGARSSLVALIGVSLRSLRVLRQVGSLVPGSRLLVH